MTSPLAARVVGREDAPAVVLLHAIATSSELWEPQVAVWADHFRVIAVDLPGHGRSPLPDASPGLDAYAESVLTTIEALGVHEAALVGLSFGSTIAQRIAVLAPERVRAVVLAAGMAYAPPPVQDMWRVRTASARADGLVGQADAILERWFTPGFLAEAPMTTGRIRRLVLSTPTEGYVAAAEVIATLDNRGILPRIHCPALVLAGEYDRAIPLDALKYIAQSVPHGRFATAPAAHLLNIEAATEVTELVGRFLSDTFASS